MPAAAQCLANRIGQLPRLHLLIMRRATRCIHKKRSLAMSGILEAGSRLAITNEGELASMRVRMLGGKGSREMRVRFAPLVCCLIVLIGTAMVIAHPSSSRAISVPSMPHFAIADFDGDNKLDFATVQLGQHGPIEGRY